MGILNKICVWYTTLWKSLVNFPVYFQHLLFFELQDLVDVRKLLKPALEYSLSSTRPPQTLVAHQKLLWAIDARASVLGGKQSWIFIIFLCAEVNWLIIFFFAAVDTKIAGFVLEMWYWWHSVLWKNSQIGVMVYKIK